MCRFSIVTVFIFISDSFITQAYFHVHVIIFSTHALCHDEDDKSKNSTFFRYTGLCKTHNDKVIFKFQMGKGPITRVKAQPLCSVQGLANVNVVNDP